MQKVVTRANRVHLEETSLPQTRKKKKKPSVNFLQDAPPPQSYAEHPVSIMCENKALRIQ